MPLLRITHTKGAFSTEQKRELAEQLTHAILVAEIGADTEHGRPVANVIFQAVDPETDWFIGGQLESSPPKGGRFMLDVVFPEGSSSQHDKSELHRAINDSICNVLGVDGTFPNRAGDWVLIHEITNGNWGISGSTMGSTQIAAVVKTRRERVDFTDAVISGYERMRKAHGFPAGVGFQTHD